MKIRYRRCAALDVHKKTVCACIRQTCGKGEVRSERQTFGTFTDDLERLGKWLREHKVKRVAMESTGVYWIPVWNILEQKRFDLELLLVKPAAVKALPGQKTDAKDAGRIAELHQYGLLRGSFIPPPPIRQLRDLVRRRTHLQQDKNRIINRIAGLLESANVKLGSVASNIVGLSGRRMLYAIAEGQRDPARLAGLALGKLPKKEGELVRALDGRFADHFRFLLNDLLDDFRYAESRVDGLALPPNLRARAGTMSNQRQQSNALAVLGGGFRASMPEIFCHFGTAPFPDHKLSLDVQSLLDVFSKTGSLRLEAGVNLGDMASHHLGVSFSRIAKKMCSANCSRMHRMRVSFGRFKIRHLSRAGVDCCDHAGPSSQHLGRAKSAAVTHP